MVLRIMAAFGWRIVVKAMEGQEAIEISSNPTIERSSGTSIPSFRRAASKAPTARISLRQCDLEHMAAHSITARVRIEQCSCCLTSRDPGSCLRPRTAPKCYSKFSSHCYGRTLRSAIGDPFFAEWTEILMTQGKRNLCASLAF